MTDKDILIQAARTASDIPSILRDQASEVSSVRRKKLDANYIAFLDEQIQLKPRGIEWDERLQRRRRLLAPFVDSELIDGIVEFQAQRFWIKVDPTTLRLVLWEVDERNEDSEQDMAGQPA
jgi:hypothetical protein